MTLTNDEIAHALRLAYLEGINDNMTGFTKPTSFNVLVAFQDKVKKDEEK